MWYERGGQFYDVSPEDLATWGPEVEARPVPFYTTPAGEQYQYNPALIGREGYKAPPMEVPTGSYLLRVLDKQARGEPLSLADQSKWEEVWRNTLQGAPTRDWRTMPLPGTPRYDESERPNFPGIGDPDYLPIMAQVHQAAQHGDQQARDMLGELRKFQDLATYQATVKQDSFSPLGDPFFGALGILGLGASAGAIAPLFAGGAGLGTTLGSLGALSGTLGQGAGIVGEALDVPGLRQAGTYLGALGGLAGGVGGLTNLARTGVQSLSDAAKVAQNVGRITGAVGRASGSDALGQASKYLGYAGQLGNAGAALLPQSFTDWSGTNSPLASNVAPQLFPSAADVRKAKEWTDGDGLAGL